MPKTIPAGNIPMEIFLDEMSRVSRVLFIIR